jgi:ankyrin repeat protein
MAVYFGSKEAVEVLLAHGADVNAKDKGNGMTPLRLAVVNGRSDVVELLRQHGAKE